MIAVTQNHRIQVALPPVVEVFAIVVGVLRHLPAVKGLVEHQHAQPVAGIQKRRRGRIMAGADGVIAAGFQQRDPALLGGVK